ncbi:MAG: TIGR00730 family Rossman fold protein [Chloroflexota bacterium]
MKRICIYCGSSDKIAAEYLEAAYQMGQSVAQRGMTVIYGAGRTGSMGAVANGAIDAGGEVWGVIPEQFNTPQLAHKGLAHLEVVENMHIRKARMAELADAFIALPGGFGTLEELFEIITWAQIGLHHNPIGLLNTKGYYNHLLTMVELADAEGFIYSVHRQLFTHADEPGDLLDALTNHRHPEGLERWVEREG